MEEKYYQQIRRIIERVREHNKKTKEELIMKACRFAYDAHLGQLRMGGQLFIEHPLAVAETLAELQGDEILIAVSLLHDVVEDTKIKLHDIKEEFGLTIGNMVDALTKIDKMYFKTNEERLIHNYRKMLIGTISDPRIIIIKLADRIHNMKTIQYMLPEKQLIIAQETLDIFAPLAYILGMYQFCIALEDLSFKILEPDKYYKINAELESYRDRVRDFENSIADQIVVNLRLNSILARIKGRVKHAYFVNKETIDGKWKIDEILNLCALRVIISDDSDCYAVLKIIHGMLTPLHRITDLIASPKINGYRSLNTIVYYAGRTLEIQIMTESMHKYAEYGLAFRLYNKLTDQENEIAQEKINKVLSTFSQNEKFKLNFHQITVCTNDGTPIVLPSHSTVLDCAYKYNDKNAGDCVGARINSSEKVLALDMQLANNDRIEFIYDESRKQSPEHLKSLKNDATKNSIGSDLKNNSEIRISSEDSSPEGIFGISNRKRIYPLCCYPVPGDSIIGQIIDDENVVVHNIKCTFIENQKKSTDKKSKTLININWDYNLAESYKLKFFVSSKDRPKLLFDISKLIFDHGVDMSFAEIKAEKAKAELEFVGKVKNLDQFMKLRTELLAVPGVLHVERFKHKDSKQK